MVLSDRSNAQCGFRLLFREPEQGFRNPSYTQAGLTKEKKNASETTDGTRMQREQNSSKAKRGIMKS